MKGLAQLNVSSKWGASWWLSAVLGGISSLLLFAALAKVVLAPEAVEKYQTVLPHFDLFRVKKPSELEIQKRALPPLPQEQKVKLDHVIPVNRMPQQAVNVELNSKLALPNISLDSDIKLTSSANLLNLAQVKLAIIDNPEVVSQLPPQYPASALRARVEGAVTIEFMINKVGRAVPESIKVVDASPKGVFDETVIRAIKRWRFKVQKVNGSPVSFSARKTLNFRLDN